MMYFVIAKSLLKRFDYVVIDHIPRLENQKANELAHITSGYKISKEILENLVEIKDKLISTDNSLEALSMLKVGGDGG